MKYSSRKKTFISDKYLPQGINHTQTNNCIGRITETGYFQLNKKEHGYELAIPYYGPGNTQSIQQYTTHTVTERYNPLNKENGIYITKTIEKPHIQETIDELEQEVTTILRKIAFRE